MADDVRLARVMAKLPSRCTSCPLFMCHAMSVGASANKETLEVKYKGKNIHNILKMTAEEAVIFFEDIPAISDRLNSLNSVGLGYLELGQSATTLSGGEAQRV